MADGNGNLEARVARLRQQQPDASLKELIALLDGEARDNGAEFAVEHVRRYIATDGADDGWQGPRPILLLYTTGRRSGAVRRNPLLYFEHGGQRYLIASKGGAEHHPEWYLNLTADPRVVVRVMGEVYEADARPLAEPDRAALWPELVARYPVFDEYQRRTTRRIPIVQLVPLG